MKKFAPLLIIAMVTIGGYFIDRSRQAEQNQVSGFFETQPVRVASRVGGRVVKINVHEGDSVTAGQVLIEFEASPNVASKDALTATAQQFEEQYKKLQSGSRPEEIARQSASVSEARWALEKLEHGPLIEEKREADERVAQAKSRYLKLVRGSRPEEIAQAEAMMNQSLARFRQAQRGLTDEERAQLQARLTGTQATERMAKQDYERYSALAANGAISNQRLEQAKTVLDQATSQRKDAEEAVRRAQLGTPKEELEQARQAYIQAQAQYRLAKEGARKEDIDAALQDLKMAESQRDLTYRGPRSEDVAAARARLASEEATLQLLKVGNRPEDIASAKAQWQAAQAQIAATAAVVDEQKVVAPCNGVIEKIDLAVGNLVSPSTPVIEMSVPNDLWIRVYLPESQLAKVKVGDDAELMVDGIADPVMAKVDAISHQGEFTPANLQTVTERGRQVFGIRLRLVKDDERIRPGMYATVKRVGRWP